LYYASDEADLNKLKIEYNSLRKHGFDAEYLTRKDLENLTPISKPAAIITAVFGESVDNLPFIGKHPTKDRIYYLLGYGGNGTVYSMLGSVILKDLILGRSNKDAEIVKLDR
jgi:glycine/D-amino acid oxidase-like deaminating enzyme